jgi:WD40 repeat protein
MTTHLSTDLSTPVLHFQPGGSPSAFDVNVSNHSAQFATFQLELLASGVAVGADPDWYRQAPDLSAKIPPGDRTRFSIEILDVPPVPGGFVGAMSLTVRVFSVELQEEERQVLKLLVEGSGVMPPRLELLTRDLVASPEAAIDLPVRIYNPNRSPMRLTLSLQGLPSEWLADGHQQRVEIPPLSETTAVFAGQLGPSTVTPSQVYPFTIEARVTAMVSNHLQGQITVLPVGYVGFELAPSTVRYPPKVNAPDLADEELDAQPETVITLNLNNRSNVSQTLMPVVERVNTSPLGRPMGGVRTLKARDHVTVPESPLTLAMGEAVALELPIAVARPWLGWAPAHPFQITVQSSDPTIPVQPTRQRVIVRSRPLVNVWLQLILLSLMAGAGLVGVLSPPRHRGPINTVRFGGQASEVLSASDDQTVRRWRLQGRRLWQIRPSMEADKAVRVARYRPVDNDAMAVGYENGSVEILSLRVQQPSLELRHDLDDRVFDLRFSRDAQTLFTGYGSGQVRRWDIAGFPRSPLSPIQQANVGFAVQALALVGPEPSRLAVGGRFNQLVLWDWQTDTMTSLPYASQGTDLDYITSFATSDRLPNRLAVADNQGRISLWDLSRCQTGQTCRPLDDWLADEPSQPLYAIAMTEDGCYLASGGEAGQVVLWQLKASGMMERSHVLGQSRQAIAAIDIVRRGQDVLVVSGGRDRRLRLHTVTDASFCRP